MGKMNLLKKTPAAEAQAAGPQTTLNDLKAARNAFRHEEDNCFYLVCAELEKMSIRCAQLEKALAEARGTKA